MRRIMSVATLLAVVLTACSGSDEPTATFTGDACDYDGPSEFDLDSTVTFTLINESETIDMGYGVWSVPEGTTADEIVEEGLFDVLDITHVNDWPGYYGGFFPPTAIDGTTLLTVSFDKPGQHALNCFEFLVADYPIMFTVSDN